MGTLAEVEVLAKPVRRRFTVEYKRRIVKEADSCSGSGEVGALLRREGLYSSHLSAWRAARDRGELAGSAPMKRGPAPKPVDPRDKRIVELERETRKLARRAERAEALVAVQKKVSELLGIQLDPPDEKS
jgi:transposase-like protein